MSIIGLQGVQAELVTALTEITGYVPELFGPHVELVNDLGLTPTEVQDAVALVERKLQLPSDPRSRGATVAAIAAQLLKHQDKGGPVDTDLDVTLEQVLAFVEECEARNERPVLETLLLETRGALARLDAAVEEPRADTVTPDAVTPDAVMKLLVEALVERTGYSADMLEPDMDLEADLGIDTVKQVEAFALARVHFGVQKDDAFRLRHHNTLRKMVHYLSSRAPAPAAVPPPVASSAVTADRVLEFLRTTMAEKTGYTLDVLQPRLDLEVDLGIDTVTQVEVFAHTRTTFGVARDESFRVRHHPTLQKMAEYLAGRASGTPAPAPAPVSEAVSVALEVSPPAVQPPGASADAVMKLLVEALVERTGYSADMLEPDMDLEADLGIDTVKQVEAFALARVHFGVQKDDAFRLRHHNTLRKMVHYLSSRAPAATAPVAASGAPTVEQLRAFLISVLQEKTGYNIEIIQPDLDLEVELGIDTVTQVEAFALTREKFGVPRDETFRVRHSNTVRKMSDRLVQLAREGLPSAPLPSVPPKRALGLDDVRRFIARSEAQKDTAALQRLATLLEERLRTPTQPLAPPARFAARRYEVHPVELNAQVKPENIAHLKGKTIGLSTDAQGTSQALARRLEEAGARVVLLSTDAAPRPGVHLDWSQPERVGKRLEELQATQPLDGLILLHTTAPAPKLMEQEASAWATTVNTFSLGLYQSALAVYDRINELPGGGWYLVATAGGGLFGHANAQGRIPLAGAAGGFVKCLKRELPNARCKVVDLDPQDTSQWAQHLWTELVSADLDVEVGYGGGRRHVFRDIETPLVTEVESASIKPGSVVVVSGGGRGVVHPCVKLLAQVTGARVILTGRTVPPVGNEEWLTVPEAQLPAWQKAFVKRHQAEHPGTTLVQAQRHFESQVAHRRELHRNLEDCRGRNIPLEYRVCDMTDARAVRALLADVRREYGRIDGIVHGATIEESKSLPMKTPDALLRTLASKAHLWQVLVQETWNDDLQFFINFGSGSGRYGNKGQTDYSLANALVAKAGLVYSTLRPGVRNVTVDWPVWVGAGIVENNTSYLSRLRAMGICVIDLPEGAYWFVGELLHGGRAGETVIADEKTFETLGWPRHDQQALRVVSREAGGTRYAL